MRKAIGRGEELYAPGGIEGRRIGVWCFWASSAIADITQPAGRGRIPSEGRIDAFLLGGCVEHLGERALC